VGHHPTPPEIQHVWVHQRGQYGSPAAGVVVGWQHSPDHHATASGWLALVATAPFEDTLAVQWVEAERLSAVRDPTPLP
jgi:hypothetical protein